MKAILEFDLNEDKQDYEIFSKATAMFSVLWETKQELRSMVKHGYLGSREITKEEYDIVEKIYDSLHDKLIEEGLNNLF